MNTGRQTDRHRTEQKVTARQAGRQTDRWGRHVWNECAECVHQYVSTHTRHGWMDVCLCARRSMLCLHSSVCLSKNTPLDGSISQSTEDRERGAPITTSVHAMQGPTRHLMPCPPHLPSPSIHPSTMPSIVGHSKNTTYTRAARHAPSTLRGKNRTGLSAPLTAPH